MANVVRYLTGFEGWPTGVPSSSGGGFCFAVTGSPTVTATAAYSGAQGLRANPTAAPDFSLDLPNFTGGQGVAAVSARIKPVTLPAGSRCSNLGIFSNAGTWVAVGVDSSGNWQIFRSDATVAVTGPAVSVGNWQFIELLVDMRVFPWALRWRIDLVEQTAGSYSVPGTTFKRGICGAWNSSNITADFYIDDIVIIDGTDTSMFPMGDRKVLGFTADPSRPAEHQSINLADWQTTPDFSAFTNFASQTEQVSAGYIDDLDIANGIQITNAADVTGNARWPLTAPSPGNYAPDAVAALIAVREAGASATSNVTFRSYLSGSTIDVFSGDPPWGVTWNYLLVVMDNRPGGGEWTQTDISQLRFEADSTDASPAIWLAGIVYEVSYYPASVTAPGPTPMLRSPMGG